MYSRGGRGVTETHVGILADANNVLRFLRGCKFNEERTRYKLTNFYIMRAKVPEWFSNRDPLFPQLQEMLDLGYVTTLLPSSPNRGISCESSTLDSLWVSEGARHIVPMYFLCETSS
ncbi:hypothetical protein PR048_019871 [Dryococelus australis]|uniref:Uncharacterized protein n=1 Tax=Dryococelus australis TaxID=614101 RepID=A0ABQ9H4S3_9NEOP|nr:hypothetical protein PR048_019871 [Dryococelus australis]